MEQENKETGLNYDFCDEKESKIKENENDENSLEPFQNRE